MVNEHHLFDQIRHLLDEMSGKDQRIPLALVFFQQQLVKQLAVVRVQPQHRLVKDHIGHIQRQRDRQLKDRLIALGQRLEFLALVQPEKRRDFVRPLEIKAIIKTRRPFEMIAHPQRWTVEILLTHAKELVMHRHVFHSVFAVDRHRAAIGKDAAGDDIQQRRLACAVAAQQTVNLSRRKGERHVVQCRHIFVLL